MSSGYPSTEDEAGGFRSPDSFDRGQEKKRMTTVEVGIVAGTIVAFTLVLFLVFYCRHLEQRRKRETATAQRKVEDGEGIESVESTKSEVFAIEEEREKDQGESKWIVVVKKQWTAIRGSN